MPPIFFCTWAPSLCAQTFATEARWLAHERTCPLQPRASAPPLWLCGERLPPPGNMGHASRPCAAAFRAEHGLRRHLEARHGLRLHDSDASLILSVAVLGAGGGGGGGRGGRFWCGFCGVGVRVTAVEDGDGDGDGDGDVGDDDQDDGDGDGDAGWKARRVGHVLDHFWGRNGVLRRDDVAYWRELEQER